MEELFLPIVLGVVEVPLAPHRPHAHARRHLHVALVADVVERGLTRRQDQEGVCPHGWHTIITRGINALIAVITLAICMINARHATYLDTKRKVLYKKLRRRNSDAVFYCVWWLHPLAFIHK